jgi:hypothetical protein
VDFKARGLVVVLLNREGTIITRHQLGPNRSVSASSYSPSRGLPSRLRPFGL